MMRRGLAIDPQQLRDHGRSMFGSLGEACMSALTRSAAGIRRADRPGAAGVAWRSGGWNFSTQAMAPDFSRLSPLPG